MRKVNVPSKQIDGEYLETELRNAGVPLVPGGAIEIDGAGLLYVVVDVEPDDATYDAIVTQTVVAHLKPPDRTPEQVKRERAKALLRLYPDIVGVLIRAIVLEIAEALRLDRIDFNRLRLDVIAGRTGAAVTAQARPVPTTQQVVDAILSRVDSIVS